MNSEFAVRDDYVFALEKLKDRHQSDGLNKKAPPIWFWVDECSRSKPFLGGLLIRICTGIGIELFEIQILSLHQEIMRHFK